MPLDPFFRERLRTHRRYLAKKASTELTARFRSAPAAAPASAPGKKAATPLSPRERHRRAALNWDRMELRTAGTPGPDMQTSEHTIAVPGHPDVRVRVYRPATAQTPAPACLVIGGGAFRIGGIDYPTADASCRRRADRSGVVLVSVGYSLAPEHRYPTQIEQVHAAWTWLHAHADELGIDPSRIGLNGASAGGCLAASLTLMNRDRGTRQPELQILEVPVTDLTGRWIDLRATYALGVPAAIALRELRSVATTYLGDRRRAHDPYASPMRASSHADLPPAVILTAEYDPLRRDGATYAAKLRAAGVDASATRYLGVTHDTPLYVGALPAARRWEDEVVAALRRL
ncbi:alpha/beta hydrolase [Microbacterium sp. EYE_5]|uniref:alpha/beta hydrolase n=1 Tax=unclassified Microbacterium TaxID=2609290 RepID=UPI00200455AB|nr:MULTISPECIES: alpha/beta hydrolase [unclassified Microbacterium]MCK6079447.1 alpha/beta hydrolase [Microbacterium sp. EYE_382]MCK6084717.1 alpha/beta hydrolase [Microbacterium sp. EYE_384]MCK6123056.1 alpha/beta hydrolase [Microbacterium sp. EYE_80]MCK6125481.1 alpha/beta hydrolase [Microbacterium sp. EYE_79]MCK6140401.1 alpha/beta hydrolase [Microbacterium sp. EYE_39]